MADKNIMMWGLLLAVLVICALWHIRENRQLTRQWKNDMSAQAAHWLVRFAWSRTVQLLCVFGCCIFIIIVYDWQLNDARQTLSAVTAAKDTSDKDLIAERKKVSDLEAAASATAAVAAAKPEPAPLQAAPNKPQTIEDVYNPEQKNPDQQSKIDDIKKRYEDILVIYMFLKKCNQVKPGDANIITSALGQEMASANAPGRLQYDIMTSAKGSYQEVYSKSPCDGKGMTALETQYNNYLKVLTTNFPPP